MKKYVNGVLQDMTENEISERQKFINNLGTKYEDRKNERENAIIKKASGKQKLKDLGLEDDEIKALMGA
mgnify:CR=1 FL=1|tara:strand:+ start:553 stop:759 length:207 start_codon:yes stop_codon:yes gene_type:complete